MPPCYTSFEYNAGGIRTKKIWYNPITDVTTTTEYKLSGTTILSETTTGAYNRTIRYIYANNELIGFEYNNNAYYYRKNLFGDIVEVYDSENNLVASYTYDAWGNCTFGTNVDNIANVNPFRYRGYYYDWETRYYYLQTRYYDPETGRFINADSIEYLDPKLVNGCNIYAYCVNSPIIFYDPQGSFFISNADAVEDGFDLANKFLDCLTRIGDCIGLAFEAIEELDEAITPERLKYIWKKIPKAERPSRKTLLKNINASSKATSKLASKIDNIGGVISIVSLGIDIAESFVRNASSGEEDWCETFAKETAKTLFIHSTTWLVAKACAMFVGGVAGLIITGLVCYIVSSALDKGITVKQ